MKSTDIIKASANSLNIYSFTAEALERLIESVKAEQPCPTCEALARTVMLDQTSHDARCKPLTEWQPIETAPKDELILVGPTKRMGICAAMNHSRDGWVTETCSEWVNIYTPTHWMPLPPSPIEAAHGIGEKPDAA